MNLDLTEIFSILAGLFVIIGVGFGAARLKIVPLSITPFLSNILMRISLPCTIFVAMVRPYDPQFLADGLTVMLLSALFTTLYAVFALGYIKITNLPLADRGAWLYCCVFSNAGFIGYPIALALYGDEGLSLAVILNMPMMLLAFTLGIFYIQHGSAVKNQTKASIWHVLFSECNICLAIGLAVYMLQIPIPHLLLTPATHLGNLTTPLSLLIVGISLAGAEVKDLFKDKQILIATVIRLLLFPALTYGILRFIGLENPMLPSLLMVLMSTPSPASSAALCASNGGNESLAAKITFLTSLLCMLTLPLWATLF